MTRWSLTTGLVLLLAGMSNPSYGQWNLIDQDYGLPNNSMENFGWIVNTAGSNTGIETLKPDGTFVASDTVKLENVFDAVNGDFPFTVEFKFNAAGLTGDVMSIRTDPLSDDGTWGMQINASTINLTDAAGGRIPSVIRNPANLGLDMSQPHIYTVHRFDSSTHPDPDDNIFLYIDQDFTTPVATRRGTSNVNTPTRVLLQFTNGGNNVDALETLHYFRAGEGIIAGSSGPPLTDFTWDEDGIGDWMVLGNWTPMVGPPGVGNLRANTTATFSGAISGPTTVVTDAPVTVNRIDFINTDHSYAVGGLGSINLTATTDAAMANPAISVLGTHEFQAGIDLHNATTVNVGSDSTLTFNNALNLNGNTLIKTGTGTLVVNNRLNNGGGLIDIAEGAVSGSGTIGGNVDNGGTIAPDNSPGVLTIDGNLNNSTGGTIAIEIEGTGGAGEADGHDQVQVTGSSTLDGSLSITTGAYTDPTTRAARDTFTLIASTGGNTGAFGTVSYNGTALSADFTGTNGSFRDHVGSGLFRNVDYDGSDVSVTNLFALEGDADGDIDIDITDFNILASNFDDMGANSATNDWTTADFDLDGDVDITDFNFLASNFADTGYGGAVNSVPEPTGILLAVLTFVVLMNRSIFNNRGAANRQSQSLG